MPGEMLWSMSTTIREAERIEGFLKTAAEMEGAIWNKAAQVKFQTLLIKNHQYLNDTENSQTISKLNAKQIEALSEKNKEMSYDMASSIFEAKQYNDPPMRGRQSMKPLVKMGLCYIVNGKVEVSNAGKKLATGKISFGDYMLEAMMKYQYPNPYEEGFKDWNTKPFVNALRLIKTVNALCKERGMKEKGVTKDEFGIFILSLKKPSDIPNVADSIIQYRKRIEKIKDENGKKAFRESFINSYLRDFNNPVKNVREYTDNMIRYFRLTKYICIRGCYENVCVDLEPCRTTEIDSILKSDDGLARTFTKEQWRKYMGDYGTYQYPFETIPILTKIAKQLVRNVNEFKKQLGMEEKVCSIPDEKNKLKKLISELRADRTELQSSLQKASFRKDLSKIDEVINSLDDIRTHNRGKLQKAMSIELEKWSKAALNVLNDCLLIKGNAPVGDDFEPTYTAGNGVADIECFYENFGAICEVTMLTNRDQWHNEGQPVMRHLRNFESENKKYKHNYCLFVAPKLHVDTMNTFWIASKYEYEGKKQNIIPVTIGQLIDIVKAVKIRLERKKIFSHHDLEKLYSRCSNTSEVKTSAEWLEKISSELSSWIAEIAA